MTTTIPLAELASAHLGKTVTIATDDGDVTGILLGVHHEADLNETYAFQHVRPLARLLTEHYVRISLRGWGERGFFPNTQATIHDPEAAA